MNQEQIEADEELARRLQQEEFMGGVSTTLSWPFQFETPPHNNNNTNTNPSGFTWPFNFDPNRSGGSTNSNNSSNNNRNRSQPTQQYPQPPQPRRSNSQRSGRTTRGFTRSSSSSSNFPFMNTPGLNELDGFASAFMREAMRSRPDWAEDDAPPPNEFHFGGTRGGSTFQFGGDRRQGSSGSASGRRGPGASFIHEMLRNSFSDRDGGVTIDRLRPEMGREGSQGGSQTRNGGGGGVGGNPMGEQFGGPDMFNLLSSLFQGGTFMGDDAPGGMRFQEVVFDDFREFLRGGGFDGAETYEDWLELIERSGNVSRGASQNEIDRLGTHKFEQKAAGASSSTGAKDGERESTEEKCAICLGEYEAGEKMKNLPCSHMFHAECVDRWLAVNRICPVCKRSIRESEGNEG